MLPQPHDPLYLSAARNSKDRDIGVKVDAGVDIDGVLGDVKLLMAISTRPASRNRAILQVSITTDFENVIVLGFTTASHEIRAYP